MRGEDSSRRECPKRGAGGSLSVRNDATDRVDRALHDEVDADAAELGTRAAWIAVYAVCGVEILAGGQLAGAHERRIDGERERRVGEARMRADRCVGMTARFQRGRIFGFEGPIVLWERVHARRRVLPLAAQSRGDRLQAAPVAAMITDEDDVAKAACAKASRRGFEDAFERRLRD